MDERGLALVTVAFQAFAHALPARGALQITLSLIMISGLPATRPRTRKPGHELDSRRLSFGSGKLGSSEASWKL